MKVDFRKDKHESDVKYDYFIEDNKEMAYALAKNGTCTLLFDYPWNQPNPTDPENIYRVSNWHEIYEFFVYTGNITRHR